MVRQMKCLRYNVLGRTYTQACATAMSVLDDPEGEHLPKFCTSVLHLLQLSLDPTGEDQA